MRRFDSSGSPLGIAVSPGAAGQNASLTTVAVADDGEFVDTNPTASLEKTLSANANALLNFDLPDANPTRQISSVDLDDRDRVPECDGPPCDTEEYLFVDCQVGMSLAF